MCAQWNQFGYKWNLYLIYHIYPISLERHNPLVDVKKTLEYLDIFQFKLRIIHVLLV